MTDIQKALKVLTEAWACDPDLRGAYQANIAMTFVDAVANIRKDTGKSNLNQQEIAQAANDAADTFLRLLEVK